MLGSGTPQDVSWCCLLGAYCFDAASCALVEMGLVELVVGIRNMGRSRMACSRMGQEDNQGRLEACRPQDMHPFFEGSWRGNMRPSYQGEQLQLVEVQQGLETMRRRLDPLVSEA